MNAYVLAYDPSPLQDRCVAINSTKNAAIFANKKLNWHLTASSDLKRIHEKPRLWSSWRVPELVGFATSNQLGNPLFAKVLYPGDVYVFQVSLIHFQFNIGKTNAVAFASLSSQNPGIITTANSVFGAKPPLSADVLVKAFQMDKNDVKYLQSQFWCDKN